jgi:nucleoside 2-deoxyribosyltransferase
LSAPNGLQKAIVDAGYLPMRIDSKEHVNKICDEIIAEIRRSKLLVADFTGQRGGVYFEAGFAMGLALPVIWTCRKDDMPNIHFDTRQYNCIDWETPDELANRLLKRIEAVIGRGPLKSR